MWKNRLVEAFAVAAIGDGWIELVAPREHSRLWVVGPPITRRIANWFVERPNHMRLLGAAQMILGTWLAFRQYRSP